jgi:hypothetical protein
MKYFKICGKLPACEVITDKSKYIGSLYLNNKRIVVILNNIRSDAHLGQLERVRYKHIVPEASIVIFPRRLVRMIKIYD